MGMFDTFHVQDRGRTLEVQTKHFAKTLGEYRLGDFIDFEQATPCGVTIWIEVHKQDWRDPACPLEWVVILLVDGCYLDAYVAETEADARQVAEVMVKLWQSPERQAEAMKRHAHDHYDTRIRYQRALEQISALLHDYVEREKAQSEGKDTTEHRLSFFHYDFDKESWDWHLARLLLEQDEFREFVPATYFVAVSLEKIEDGNTT